MTGTRAAETAARKERLIAAATALAAEGGYDAVQMRDVAAPGRGRARHPVPPLRIEGSAPARGDGPTGRDVARTTRATTAERRHARGTRVRRAAARVALARTRAARDEGDARGDVVVGSGDAFR